jgi:hypothetical protein
VQCRFDTHALSDAYAVPDTNADTNSDPHAYTNSDPHTNTDACSIDLGG